MDLIILALVIGAVIYIAMRKYKSAKEVGPLPVENEPIHPRDLR